MRKRAGLLLVLLGLLLCLAALGLAVYNLYVDILAGEEATVAADSMAEVLAEQPIRAVSTPAEAELDRIENGGAKPLELDGRLYLGMLTIPSLELQLPVQQEWSYANLRVSPCRMSGSVWNGDLVILGHNYNNHFGNLGKVRRGDEVDLTLTNGLTLLYRVDAIEVLPPTAVDSVTSGEWPLTLFTCTLSGRTRLVVRCDVRESAH